MLAPPRRGRSLWDWLPPDVEFLVLAHRAATVVQLRWHRWQRYAHARAPCWHAGVRAHLASVRAWRELHAFAAVRREWRQEPESWLGVDAACARVLRAEAADGLWGAEGRGERARGRR